MILENKKQNEAIIKQLSIEFYKKRLHNQGGSLPELNYGVSLTLADTIIKTQSTSPRCHFGVNKPLPFGAGAVPGMSSGDVQSWKS